MSFVEMRLEKEDKKKFAACEPEYYKPKDCD